MFYKILNNLTPIYMKHPFPPQRPLQYCLGNQDVTGRIKARTEKLLSSFYPHCLSEWNKFDPEIRLAPSVAVFKKQLLSIIRRPAKSFFGIHGPIGLSHLCQLRVALSKLNFHKFKHNFRDTINLLCPSNDGIEDTEHFLLFCPSFTVPRRDLLIGVLALLRPYGYVNNSNEALTQILLYGNKNLSNDLNKRILLLTLNFIHQTGRLDYS